MYFTIFSEFYDDDKNLIDYNCPKKEDFIKKGIGKIKIIELSIFTIYKIYFGLTALSYLQTMNFNYSSVQTKN